MSDDFSKRLYAEAEGLQDFAADIKNILCTAAFKIGTQNTETTRLRARVAELEEALGAAGRVLHKAGEQFTAYANQHAAKGTADGDQKAATNQQWAQRCFNAHDAALAGGKDE